MINTAVYTLFKPLWVPHMAYLSGAINIRRTTRTWEKLKRTVAKYVARISIMLDKKRKGNCRFARFCGMA